MAPHLTDVAVRESLRRKRRKVVAPPVLAQQQQHLKVNLSTSDVNFGES